MIAYHVDRTNRLHIGQKITLTDDHSFMSSKCFEHKISNHGRNYLDTCWGANLPSFIIEYGFELVRQKFFPDCISRYQSFFALRCINDLIYWPELLNPEFKIYEIEFDHNNIQELDAAFLNGGPNLNSDLEWSPQTSFEFAFRYWNGEHCDKPKPELLILPPVTVKAQKHLSISLT